MVSDAKTAIEHVPWKKELWRVILLSNSAMGGGGGTGAGSFSWPMQKKSIMVKAYRRIALLVLVAGFLVVMQLRKLAT
jgi:hypothetical protein